MDKLFEHTLQQQVEAMRSEQNSKVDALQAQVAELTQMLRGQLIAAPQGAAAAQPLSATTIGKAAQVNTGPTTNIANQTINQVNIVPWDGDRRISVDVAQIAAAFIENVRLQEYARMGDHELIDPEKAPPYVTELLMDLTKRAHTDPAARNVYLNPRRADQALVHMKTGKWEVLPLQEATRLLFDGVAQGITAVSRYEERSHLPLEAQNALAMAGLLYDEEPEEYAKRAKAPMSAHLVNTAPEPALGEK